MADSAYTRLIAMRDAIREFGNKIVPSIQDLIRHEESLIIDMNAEDQLYEDGVNTEGIRIDSYQPYRPYTVEIKQSKGQITDHVTLRDEGDFEGSFYIKIGLESWEIDASDWKTGNLVAKYNQGSGEVLGLTDENLNELIWNYLYPALLKVRKTFLPK